MVILKSLVSMRWVVVSIRIIWIGVLCVTVRSLTILRYLGRAPLSFVFRLLSIRNRWGRFLNGFRLLVLARRILAGPGRVWKITFRIMVALGRLCRVVITRAFEEVWLGRGLLEN